MANQTSAPFGSSAPTAEITGAAPRNPATSVAGSARESRQPIVRYVGFRSTDHGREYVMQVSEGLSTRSFVLIIPHHAFASKQARFQDGPDLCSGKLRRELAVDPDLPGDDSMAVTAQDLVEYHDSHARAPAGGRSRAKPQAQASVEGFDAKAGADTPAAGGGPEARRSHRPRHREG